LRLLFLTHRLPYAPNRGDRIRAFHLLRHLSACAQVTLVSLVHDAKEAAHVDELRPFVDEIRVAMVPRAWNLMRAAARLPTDRPLTLELLHAPAIYAQLREVVRDHPPDLVLAYCSGMVRYAMEEPLSRFPFVLDMVDVDSEKWRILAETGAWPKRVVYRREARCLSRFEARAVQQALVTLTVNQKEADAIHRLVPTARVAVVENGIDLETFCPPGAPSAQPTVVFCGVLDYAPNDRAALRIVNDIWPLVLDARPDARLFLVGARPTANLRARAAESPSITVTGEVPDVKPFLWNAAVAAVPLRTARGLQNKVLEALAAGLPTVISPVVAEGLPQAALAGCRIADADADFARALLDWLNTPPTARRQQAGRADLDSLTWSRQLRSLCGLVTEAASRPVRIPIGSRG
jgi:sugar transferase (PEP-CTERM/EpsH1 system associated)